LAARQDPGNGLLAMRFPGGGDVAEEWSRWPNGCGEGVAGR
jgi:hypothetical protein